jgi:hypothetical protein
MYISCMGTGILKRVQMLVNFLAENLSSPFTGHREVGLELLTIFEVGEYISQRWQNQVRPMVDRLVETVGNDNERLMRRTLGFEVD